LSGQARDRLHRHDWPGNFRELRSLLEVLRLHAEPDGRLDEGAIRDALAGYRSEWGSLGTPTAPQTVARPAPFTAAEEREREMLQAALAAHDGNRSRAAQSLGMDRTTLWRKLHRLRLIPDRTPS